MGKLIDLIFGIEGTRELLDVSLSLNFGVPSWLFAFLIILLAWVSFKLYKEEAKSFSKRLRISLMILRWLSSVLVLWLVLQPKIKIERMVEPKSQLAVLIDSSDSMSLLDKGAPDSYFGSWFRGISIDATQQKTLTRLDYAKTILSDEKLDWQKRLETRFDVRYYQFSKTVRELQRKDDGSLDFPVADGWVTQLGSSLREAKHQLKGLPLSSMVLLTDGASNRGDDPSAIARRLGEEGVRIYPVGIGYADAVDIKVVNIAAPELVFKKDECAVDITFEGKSLKQDQISVKIFLDDQMVNAVALPAQDGIFVGSAVIRPPKVGTFSLKVVVAEMENEPVIENNSLSKELQVIERQIRVLLALENPSWEYRYLKGILDRDPRYDTKVFMRKGDLRRKQNDPEYLDRFPFEDLKKNYDVIIMNNLHASYFDEAKMREVQDFVSEAGGALVMLSSTYGTPSSYFGTPIGDMLPIEFTRIEEDPSEDLEETYTKPYSLTLTRNGQASPLTRLSPLTEENIKLWRTLPGQYWYYPGIKKAKLSAEVLVEYKDKANEYGPLPLIALQRFGKGEVMFVGFNSIWRWRYKIGNKITQRFWSQLVQVLGLPHLLGYVDRVVIETEGRDFDVGDPVEVDIKIMTEDYSPWLEDSISLIALNKDTQEEVEIPVGGIGDKNGRYRGLLNLKEGHWDLSVKELKEEKVYSINILKPKYELLDPAMNKKILVNIAEASGGQYIEPDQLGELPDLVAEQKKLLRQNLEKDIWDVWIFFSLVVLLTAIEWTLRKRNDLA